MQIDQPQLFIKKLARLLGVTIILVPLIHYRLVLPTYAYISSLLVLHIYIFFVYLSKIDWHHLRESRSGFILRLAGIVLFAYALTLLHFQGPTYFVLLSIGAAVGIHAIILLLLMMTKSRTPALPQP
jgi:hypothetical protein